MLPSVLYQSLLWWGLPLVGLPVLIHLINMMRHKRVQWAAMEFLLQSQKRHRTWIILKQLLLLLLRMAVVAAVVFMLAQPLLRGSLASLLGQTRTHHIVLLDDSYSMSDRAVDRTAFSDAKAAVERLAAQAAHQDSPQSFTLVRFSKAKLQGKESEPDLLDQPVDADFAERLRQQLGGIAVSQSAVGPEEALAAVDSLTAQKADDENRTIYVVSDFRAKDWNEPTAARKSLSHLTQGGARLQLINCATAAHDNLTLSSLKPIAGTHAAGVQMFIEVGVKNFGSTIASDVAVELEEDGRSRPALVIESIPAGKTVLRRFPVLFTAAGEHEVSARLRSDAVAIDNVRHAVIDVAPVVPVLLIDGDPRGLDAFFVSSALAPGGKTNSGLQPTTENPRFLREHDLAKYAAIFLLNVDRLDKVEIEALETYVKVGGGLAFFVGEQTQREFVNGELYREGQGLFPVPLGPAAQLLVDRSDKAPDLEVTTHPIFTVFAGERNSFLGTVNVERFFTVPKSWSAPTDSTVKVIAQLRTGAPLVVEQKFGEGRVVAFLTKAAPVETSQGPWNNWGRNNPSYVVAMLELEGYLASTRQLDDQRLVGSPLEVRFAPTEFQRQVRFVLPAADTAGGETKRDPAEAGGSVDLTVDVTAEAVDGALDARLTETETAGLYEAQLTTPTGTVSARRFALNVVPEEGNLKALDRSQLAARLPGIEYQYHQATDLTYDPQQLAGFNVGESLLYLLVGLLIGEQTLAYFASYHSTFRKGARG